MHPSIRASSTLLLIALLASLLPHPAAARATARPDAGFAPPRS
jgi:hypothetical protein